MKLLWAAWILASLPGFSLLSAQESYEPRLLAWGDRIDSHVVVDGGRSLMVQGEMGISLFNFKPKAALVVDFDLPSSTYLWDYQPAKVGSPQLLSIGQKGFSVSAAGRHGRIGKALLPSQGFFRGRLEGTALRSRMLNTEAKDRWICLPTLSGFEIYRFDAEFTAGLRQQSIKARVNSIQSLGYGIGYRMQTRMTVPFYSWTDIDGDGSKDFLFRRGDDFAWCSLTAGSKPKSWGPAPLKESTEVLGFDHRVPSLTGDFDGDGRGDLLHCDTGNGNVFVYRGAKRATQERVEPEQVFRLGGHVLWRWFVDGDGDGKQDLFLLTLGRLNIVAQVSVIKNRALPVRLTMRRQMKDGRFSVSADWNDKFSLPCEIAMTRSVKRVRFRSPLRILSAKDQSVRLMAPQADGGLGIFRRGNKTWELIRTTAKLVVENGYVAAPFASAVNDTGIGKSSPVLTKEPGQKSDHLWLVDLD